MVALDEIRQDFIRRTIVLQQQISKWHDKFIKAKEFKQGDWTLLFYSKFKYFQGKFQTHWLGPYEIDTIFHNGVVKIKTIDDEKIIFLVNGHRLRLYHNPLTNDEFVKYLQDKSEFKLFKKGDSSPHSPTSL